MTTRALRTAKLSDSEGTRVPRAQKTADPGYAHRVAAVLQLATELLAQIEQHFQDDPLAIVDRQEGAQPREIEDARSYFLEKIEHARETLREMVDLVRPPTGPPDKRELIRSELMALFVLVESLRPSHLSEAVTHAGDETGQSIYKAIDALGLDVINLRQRLK